jgi:hypothetical protein
MNRADALRTVIDCLNAEIAALKAFDVDALAAATTAKDRTLDTLKGGSHAVSDDEVRALAAEAAQLNETARVFVNLMSANVRRQLEQLNGGGQAATYAPRNQLRVVA